MLILAIETSCDDTAVAVLRDERDILSNVVASQLTHREFGGVVPEIASRQHLRFLLPVLRAALQRAHVTPETLDAVAATNGPGLLGSLLVGLSLGKAYALGLGIPFVGVHHIEGHILANSLVQPIQFPCVVLVISGGHTQIIHMPRMGAYEELGSTRDDAAGEAFDKIGKMLGIPYPAGPVFEQLAKRGNPQAVLFTRAKLRNGAFDFSFSGLKTAARRKFEAAGLTLQLRLGSLSHEARRKAEPHPKRLHQDRTPEQLEALPREAFDILASAQEAIVDMLSTKFVAAVQQTAVQHVYLAGGVAANEALRVRLAGLMETIGCELHYPPARFCTDNAVMIASAAYFRLRAGQLSELDTNAFARGALQTWA